MTESEASEYRPTPMNEYYDRLAVTIFEVEYPIEKSGLDEWHLILSSRGGGSDLNSIESVVEEFLRENPSVTRSVGQGYPPSYELSISKKHFSWGASGVAIDVVIAVSGWVGTSLAWDALKALAAKLKGRVFDEIEIEPLTEEEAVQVARGEVYRRHAVSPDLLRLVSVEISVDNLARLAFVDHNGVDYDIRIAKAGDVAAIVNILRRFPEVKSEGK